MMRRNPWPISIIAFFALAVTACVGFVVFCSFNGSDLVAEDYYEQEIAYQKHMESLKRARELDQPATIAYDAERLNIQLQLPPTHSGTNASGTVTLYRPSSSRLDRELPLMTDDRGRQNIDAAGLASGPWKVKVLWSVGGLQYLVEQNIIAGGNSDPGA